MKKFYGSYQSNTIYVEFDLLTKCNLDCSYCFAKYFYSQNDKWGKTNPFKDQKIILKSIGMSPYPVHLMLLGGEPTIHPNYTELVDIAHKEISKHKEGRLTLVTNGTANIDFFKFHKNYKQFDIVISIHFEYRKLYGDDNYNIIMKKISILLDRGFKVTLNLTVPVDMSYYNDIFKFLQISSSLKQKYSNSYFIIRPEYILPANGKIDQNIIDNRTKIYSKIWKDLNLLSVQYTLKENSKINIFDEFEVKDYNNFKGWICEYNAYRIDFDGYINDYCNSNLYSNVNIKDNLFYFKNIKDKKIKCTFDYCQCYYLLNRKKELKDLNNEENTSILNR